MLKEGYQPNKGELDSSNSPKGGSGLTEKTLCLGKYKRLNLKKDDVIIINIKGSIPDVGVKRIIEQIKKVFPDNKAVILTEGSSLSIIRNKKNQLK